MFMVLVLLSIYASKPFPKDISCKFGRLKDILTSYFTNVISNPEIFSAFHGHAGIYKQLKVM
jgi:hypothetical protein